MISCALVYQIGAGPIVSSASEALRVLKFEGSARYNVHDYIRKHFGAFHHAHGGPGVSRGRDRRRAACRRTDGRSGRPLALAHRELGGRVSGSLRTPSVGCNKCASPVSDDVREAIAATERLIRLRQTSCRRCRARAGQSPGRRRRPRRSVRHCPRCAGRSSGSSRSCARRSAARSGRPRAR